MLVWNQPLCKRADTEKQILLQSIILHSPLLIAPAPYTIHARSSDSLRPPDPNHLQTLLVQSPRQHPPCGPQELRS